jgi:hypothetical protein
MGMKRIWGYVVSMLAAATVVGGTLPACATNDQTIFIRNALAPSVNRQGGSCIYTNDPSQAGLFQAEMDIGLTDSYFGILLVGNQLVARGDPANNRAESSRVHINGGIVRVTEPGGRLINEFTSLATGFNDPQNNNAPGYGTIGLVLIDAPTKDRILTDSYKPEGEQRVPLDRRNISKTVLINVKAFGQTLGGVDVESEEYQLPMQVCNGCLVVFDGFDPTRAPPAVPGAPENNCLKAPEAVGAGGTTGPCRAGQDIALSCRLCQGLEACDPNKLR